MTKILILVLAIDKEPWDRIEKEGQNLTWKREVPEKVEIFRYVGSSDHGIFPEIIDYLWKVNQFFRRIFGSQFVLLNSFFRDDFLLSREFKKPLIDFETGNINTCVPDKYSLIGLKTLDAFQIVLDRIDFDYIYRTNVSSYIDLNKLNAFISKKSKKNFYSGPIGTKGEIKFASGSGYFLSRDLVEKVLTNRSQWDHTEIDDVALGKLISGLGIEISEIGRVDIVQPNLVSEVLLNVSAEIFHYRCKTLEPETCISIMKELDRHLTK